jgi:hypothetical protein
VSSDREILLLSARGYWYRTYPIDPALQCDREFMLELLSRNGMLYERLDEEIQKNTEYATVALASAIEMLRPMTTLSSTFPTNFAAHFAEIIFIMFENTQIRENTDLLQKLENGAKFMISNPMGDVRTYGAAIQRKLATLFETD